MQLLSRRQKLAIRILGRIKLTDVLYAGYCKIHGYYTSKLHGCHYQVLYCNGCIQDASRKRKQEKEVSLLELKNARVRVQTKMEIEQIG